ncbi:hypothetical protein Tco_0493553, partial [Tanacetum coccineum]
KLVKTKHGYTRPEEAYERVLWGDLKVMFEPDVEDDIRRNLQGQKILLWKLYDSCGIHFVRFENMHIYMLVEKRYPLSPTTITDMQLTIGMKHFREGLLGIKGFLTVTTAGSSYNCWLELLLLLKIEEKVLRDDAEVSTSTVQETTHMVSSVKLPMLKKGKYTIWAIRMEEYLIHTDYE